MSGHSPAAGLEVWLATPEARNHFDPARLAAADREAWMGLRTARRRRDWESSRALLDAVDSAGGRETSLSHSHGYAAIALAPAGVAVGIDIEWLAPRDFRGMASVAYSATECSYLDTLENRQDLCAAFYELWTLKEACAKALRLPLFDALRQCRFTGYPNTPAFEVPTLKQWRAMVFAPRPQLRLTVVTLAESDDLLEAPVAIREWPQLRTKEWSAIRSLASDGAGERA